MNELDHAKWVASVERTGAIKTQILNALRAQRQTGPAAFDPNIELWTPGGMGTNQILTGGLLPDDYAGIMARNLVAVFGERVFIGIFNPIAEEQS